MGVYSDGTHYDVPEGIFFSFPTIFTNGDYEIVKGLELDDSAKDKIKACITDLLDEKAEAFDEKIMN